VARKGSPFGRQRVFCCLKEANDACRSALSTGNVPVGIRAEKLVGRGGLPPVPIVALRFRTLVQNGLSTGLHSTPDG